MKKLELRNIIREVINEQFGYNLPNMYFSLHNLDDAIAFSQDPDIYPGFSGNGSVPDFNFDVCQLTAAPAGPIIDPQSLGSGDACFNYNISNPTTDELMSFLPLVDAEGYFPSGNNSCQAACVAPILGCTDPAAVNFNPEADTDDGSCVILGCTDDGATNFNPNATTEDGSCIFDIAGCMDSDAINYNPNATIDGSGGDYGDGCIYDSGTDDFSGGPGGGPTPIDLGLDAAQSQLSVDPSTMGPTPYKTPQRKPPKGNMQRGRMQKLANIKPRRK